MLPLFLRLTKVHDATTETFIGKSVRTSAFSSLAGRVRLIRRLVAGLENELTQINRQWLWVPKSLKT
ncbi:hypothetical protein KFU94_27290 [Chloroflexi bacterium TSY]|nr:hypothetical protein [Chloroflexi bacterium TSY]